MSDVQTVFQIEKIYVKDLSLEIPGAPQVFLQNETPQLEVQIRSEAKPAVDALHEVAVTVTVTARVGEKTLFLVEATQAGLFTLRGIPAGDMEPVLGVACPNILYPYVRETISDVVTRGGFPPVLLAPVNFEALYTQARQQEADASRAAGAN